MSALVWTARWPTLELLLWLVIGLVVLLALLELVWRTARLGIGPTPSGALARAQLIALCRAELSERVGGARLYELGSGWGGLARALSQSITLEHTVTGLELSWAPLLVSRLMTWLLAWRGTGARLSFERGDLVALVPRLRGGELLVCYLCPEQLQRLSTALKAQPLPPQLTLISLLFALPEHSPTQRVVVENLYRDPIWLYHLS